MEAGLNWRDDPGWRLSTWDPRLLTERPADRPGPAAELANPDLWATLYVGHRAAATWFRTLTVTPADTASKLTRQANRPRSRTAR